MWCGKCQADVAAEVSPDNQRVFCTICGALLSTIDLPPTRPIAERLSDRTKDARELLQRWSSGQVLDPFGPLPKSPTPSNLLSPPNSAGSLSQELAQEGKSTAVLETSPLPSAAAEVSVPATAPATFKVAAVQHEPTSESTPPRFANPLAASVETARPPVAIGSNPLTAPASVTNTMPATIPTPFVAAAPPINFHRIDAAHPADHFASAAKGVPPSETAAGPFAAKPALPETKREPRRIAMWFPTWDPAVWRSEPNAAANWSSMAGQFLAYAGVLGLTAGACLVVWSYFGGPANYAPMGWLLATAGQMLLFFGVVTLVSGGLEQTTEQVNKRIEQLGDHIIRIEQAAREISLRGPVPPAHFGSDPNASAPPRSAASGYERSVVEE
jgi:hypothetical protein